MKVSDFVERKGSTKDYTTGRQGLIVDVDGDRFRVRWLREKDGSPITTMGAKPENGVRTWVNMRFLKIIEPQKTEKKKITFPFAVGEYEFKSMDHLQRSFWNMPQHEAEILEEEFKEVGINLIAFVNQPDLYLVS